MNSRGHVWDMWVWTHPLGSLYIFFWPLPTLSLILEWVRDEMASTLFWFMWPAQVASDRVVFIGRFYNTFINRLRNFYAFKYINRFIKSNRLPVKSLQIRLFAPTIGQTISQIPFCSVTLIYPDIFAPGNKSNYLLRSMRQSKQRLNFNTRGFLVQRYITHFCFDSEFTGKNTHPTL